ncbi:MAG TPA: DUF481 domain-containing protein [Gammaproteobacteria bacterium]|nr:DUF481 domain-containing protein [Gammaproteobacteria bacterium]
MHRPIVALLLFASSGAAMAQNPPPPPQGLSGKVAFGYLATSGNSKSDNLNLSFNGRYDAAPWHHSLDGLAVKASANDVDTAEAYRLSWNTQRDLAGASYVFGFVGWNQDEFSSYARQLRESIGYGRRFIDRARQTLSAEAGAGYRRADLRDGTSESEAIARLAVDYRLTLSETSDFSQRLSIESGSSNTYLESTSALRTDIWKNIGLVLSYTIKRNSSVPVGLKKRDTFTAVSLEYSF